MSVTTFMQGQKVYTVSEINNYLKRQIESDEKLNFLLINGEISNFKQYPSGHCYFSLKDANSLLKAVMFKNKAVNLQFKPQNGLKVLAYGHIAIYERDGVYQLYVEFLAEEGVGELTKAFEALKEKLLKEGLFKKEHKKPLPFLPKAIGVVTSSAGAVIQDIIKVAKRRNPYLKIVLFPVAVQGKEAATQIVYAIEKLNEVDLVDVLIVGRGGGSLEDLWPFNEEKVVRAIYKSRIPIVSAVGHETDFTLADFVADERAATPSQAAEIIAVDYWQMVQFLEDLKYRLKKSIKQILKSYREKIVTFFIKNAINKMDVNCRENKMSIKVLQEKLIYFSKTMLKNEKRLLTRQIQKLIVLNPLAVLKRGFAIVSKGNQEIIDSVKNLKIDEEINIRFYDGKVQARVEFLKEESRNFEKE